MKALKVLYYVILSLVIILAGLMFTYLILKNFNYLIYKKVFWGYLMLSLMILIVILEIIFLVLRFKFGKKNE